MMAVLEDYWFAFVIAMIIWSVYNAVVSLIVGLLLGAEFASFGLLCFLWEKEDGKIHVRKKRFTFLAACSMRGNIMEDQGFVCGGKEYVH